jgi:hypothetical protein
MPHIIETRYEITSAQIRALRDEAGAAGDHRQVALCDEALAGDSRARRLCAEAIESARAQGDAEVAP